MRVRCSASEAGSYSRHIDSCITHLKAQGPSRTCNASKEEEKRKYLGLEASQSCAQSLMTLRPEPRYLFFFFFTLFTGPRRCLNLKLSDIRVYEPQIQARLGTTAQLVYPQPDSSAYIYVYIYIYIKKYMYL